MPDLQPFLLCFEKKRTVQRFPLVHTLFFTQQESSDLEEHQVLLLKQETDKMKVYFKKTSGPTRRGRLDISARYCEKWNRIFFFFLQCWGLDSRSTPWATPPTLFCDGLFWDRVSRTVCLDWLQTPILLIFVSWVARITGVSHRLPDLTVFLGLKIQGWGIIRVGSPEISVPGLQVDTSSLCPWVAFSLCMCIPGVSICVSKFRLTKTAVRWTSAHPNDLLKSPISKYPHILKCWGLDRQSMDLERAPFSP
jgi:hypothetical protein